MRDLGLPDGIPVGINKFHLLATNPELIKKLANAGIDLDTAIKIVEDAGEEFLQKVREQVIQEREKQKEFLINLAETTGAKKIAELLKQA